MMLRGDPLHPLFYFHPAKGRRRGRLRKESGAVAVMVAISLTVLLTVLAFVLEAGYLYGEKNRIQDAVEAAAMAGAATLCENPEETARQIAASNLFPDAEDWPEGYELEVAVGHFDETGQEDFSGVSAYGHTAFLESAALGDNYVENAVHVRLKAVHRPLLPGVVAETDRTLMAEAVAYAVDYDMLSLDADAAIDFSTTKSGFPEYRGMRIHSNGDIVRSSAGAPDMDADTLLSACGAISGFDGEIVDREVALSPVDFGAYLNQADRVIRYSDFTAGNPDAPVAIGDNQGFIGTGGANDPTADNPVFQFKEGNHDGAVYYYSAEDDPDGNRTLFISQFTAPVGYRQEYAMHGFTLVSEIPVAFDYRVPGSGSGGCFGGTTTEDTVRIVSAGKISTVFSLTKFRFDGVVLRTEDEFNCTERIKSNNDPSNSKLKITAAEGMDINIIGIGNAAETVFSGGTMRPCQRHHLRLGRLD